MGICNTKEELPPAKYHNPGMKRHVGCQTEPRRIAPVSHKIMPLDADKELSTIPLLSDDTPGNPHPFSPVTTMSAPVSTKYQDPTKLELRVTRGPRPTACLVTYTNISDKQVCIIAKQTSPLEGLQIEVSNSEDGVPILPAPSSHKPLPLSPDDFVTLGPNEQHCVVIDLVSLNGAPMFPIQAGCLYQIVMTYHYTDPLRPARNAASQPSSVFLFKLDS
eukprot:TRINITY_DN77_c0_g1::TRINITY_DN77_c0_g1_i1::g.14839::m.14839 TRINITY_DN77_c0_g1::TRINITY_DN77_c0_g1_i1::g.14839  ORF type:complete len:219 (+),score=6.44 TRINITY_DN77_c0_g1_i1:111-767(+)